MKGQAALPEVVIPDLQLQRMRNSVVSACLQLAETNLTTYTTQTGTEVSATDAIAVQVRCACLVAIHISTGCTTCQRLKLDNSMPVRLENRRRIIRRTAIRGIRHNHAIGERRTGNIGCPGTTSWSPVSWHINIAHRIATVGNDKPVGIRRGIRGLRNIGRDILGV